MSSYDTEHNITLVAPRRVEGQRPATLAALLASGDQDLATALALLIDPDMAEHMLELLGSKSHGVPEEFIDSLERVRLQDLHHLRGAPDLCPICTSEFLLDPHPLVVALPNCKHVYDMDCIRPWLQANNTCPMCRVDVLAKRKIDLPPDDEEEEADWEMYG